MHHKSLLTSIVHIAGLALTLILPGRIATSEEPSRFQQQAQTPVQRLPSTRTLPHWIKLADAQSPVVPSQPVPFCFEFTGQKTGPATSREEQQRAMPPVLRGPTNSSVLLSPTVRRLPVDKTVRTPRPSELPSPKPSELPSPKASPLNGNKGSNGSSSRPPFKPQAAPPAQSKSNPAAKQPASEPTPAIELATPPKQQANSPATIGAEELPPPPTVITEDKSQRQPAQRKPTQRKPTQRQPTQQQLTPSKPTQPKTTQPNSKPTLKQADDFNASTPSLQPPNALPIVEPNEIVRAIQQQVDIQQQQLDTLQELMQATSERLVANENENSSSNAGTAITPAQFAAIAAHQQQSLQRDAQVAREFDTIRERIDAIQRNGVPLPAPARENFMPTRYNESPIAHYGQLAVNYDDFEDTDSKFSTPVYFGRFLALLNEKLLLDVNTVIGEDDFELASAQLDWYATDNLTISTGRLYAPIGFFNERLQSAWVWKSVDVPLMFNQVFPNRFAMNGVSARGAFYPGMIPVKFEYAFFGGNGVALDYDNPDVGELANFRAFSSTFNDNNNDKAFGGRVGIALPELGIIAGLSGMTNGAYDNDGYDGLDLWGFDFSLHRGNWDYRFEMIQVNQQSGAGPIDRNGWYTQLAYRNLRSAHRIWNKVELLARVDSVDFDGIDLTQLDLNSIRREDQTIDRHRFTLQANYYVHPSLIVKAGYEILDEHGIDEISDNGFLAQVVFGF